MAKKIIYYLSILTAVLAAAASGSCSTDKSDLDDMTVNPVHALYKVEGTIVDEQGAAIAGLQVELTSDKLVVNDDRSIIKGVTDKMGKFALQALVQNAEKGINFEISIKDNTNTYENKVVAGGFDNPQFANGDGNFHGETTKVMADIQMKLKKDEQQPDDPAGGDNADGDPAGD